jgi:hypothetical protein
MFEPHFLPVTSTVAARIAPHELQFKTSTGGHEVFLLDGLAAA